MPLSQLIEIAVETDTVPGEVITGPFTGLVTLAKEYSGSLAVSKEYTGSITIEPENQR